MADFLQVGVLKPQERPRSEKRPRPDRRRKRRPLGLLPEDRPALELVPAAAFPTGRQGSLLPREPGKGEYVNVLA